MPSPVVLALKGGQVLTGARARALVQTVLPSAGAAAEDRFSGRTLGGLTQSVDDALPVLRVLGGSVPASSVPPSTRW